MILISEKVIGSLITIMISDSGNSIENTFKFDSDIFVVNNIMNFITFEDGIDKFFKESEERICKISLNNNYLESKIEKKFISTEKLPEYYMINEDISSVPLNGKHQWKIIITENENEFEIFKETFIPESEKVNREFEEKGFAVIEADGPIVTSKYQLTFKGNNFKGKIEDCPQKYIEEISNKAIDLFEKSKKYLNLNHSSLVNIKNLIEKNKNRIINSVESYENDNLFVEKNESILEKSNMNKFVSLNLKTFEEQIAK